MQATQPIILVLTQIYFLGEPGLRTPPIPPKASHPSSDNTTYQETA